MATEKKTSAKNTTAKKTTAKKATCKATAKCATKKTVKAAAPKHIGLVKNDPYLADFEPAIVGRHEHALWKLSTSLPVMARFRSAISPTDTTTSDCTRRRRDGCSASGRQMLQISISSVISTVGRKALSIVPSVSRVPATGS